MVVSVTATFAVERQPMKPEDILDRQLPPGAPGNIDPIWEITGICEHLSGSRAVSMEITISHNNIMIVEQISIDPDDFDRLTKANRALYEAALVLYNLPSYREKPTYKCEVCKDIGCVICRPEKDGQ